MGSENSNLDIYWNLHQDCWSVRRQGLVVLHSYGLIAKEVKLVVQPAGRNRVLQTGRKNVHAFVRAASIILNYPVGIDIPTSYVRIRYNPYKNSTFVDQEGYPIHFADYIFMQSDGKCYAKIRK